MVPVIGCMNFDAPRYNTKENSPDGSLLTVLDVLDFTNNAVFNYLVDKAQIERVILTTDDRQATIVHHRLGCTAPVEQERGVRVDVSEA